MANGKHQPWYNIEATDQEIGLQGIMTLGHYQTLPRTLVRLLGDAEAILLSFLMNHGKGIVRPTNQIRRRKRGWFYCSRAVIERELGYLKDKQQRTINSLKEKNLLVTEIENRGFKRQRWFRINYALLYNQCCEMLARMKIERMLPDDDDVPFDEDE